MTQLHRTGKRDIVLWKLFRQTFYCQPESGGSHDTGYTLVMGTHSLIISLSSDQSLWGWPQPLGPQCQECNAQAAAAAAVMITIHSLPALQHYNTALPRITLLSLDHDSDTVVTWLMSHMCNVSANGLPSPATGKHPLHPLLPLMHRPLRARQWGHCPQSSD